MKAYVPVLAIAGAALVAGVCLVAIPVPKPMPDFSVPVPATPSAPRDASTGTATAVRTAPAAADTTTVRSGFRPTRWQELIPKDWDPYAQLGKLQQGVRIIADDDPRAVERLQKVREIWDSAPVNPALDGMAVRIPGYVVPLESGKAGTTEFLLVPYVGACIHTPPPPSNQVVRVLANSAIKGLHTMDPVYVSGVLAVSRSESAMGASSYRVIAMTVEAYESTR